MFCEEKNVSAHLKLDCTGEQSFEGTLLEILSIHLNFTYKLYPARMKNYTGGLWSALIENIHDGLFNFGVGGVSITGDRMGKIDFIDQFANEKFVALYSSRKGQTYSFLSIFLPFSLTVWFFLVLTPIILALFIYQMVKLFHETNLSLYSLILSNMYMYLVEQCTKYWHTFEYFPNSIRIIILGWWAFCLIMCNTYKSHLAASMLSTLEVDPNTLEDLVAQNYNFHFNNEDSTTLKDSMINSTNKIYSEIYERSFSKYDGCESLERSLSENFAIIDEFSSLKFQIYFQCTKLSHHHKFRKLHGEILPSRYSWAFQKRKPYITVFSRKMLHLYEAGIVHKMYRGVFYREGAIPYPNSETFNEDTVLDMYNILSVIIFWAIGLFVSCIVFVLERYWVVIMGNECLYLFGN
ncbi:glutamate receptor ionotropic, delta-1-like [Chrysoperla carnea]|uniref:glutamate receptor ionotropic, delta-1-like n=1 Tax=Chrysoperla carnea TaxID=189513 RepID=UPI001D0984BC|nr:glutamate receptor ionotropic, delta-1-like [Chrysoperla carnea]